MKRYLYLATCVLCLFTHAVSAENYTVEVWADNWFQFNVNGAKIAEDSVPITTERSFNAERFSFEAEAPFSVGLIAMDFKENNSGLEYIGTRKQQMGDGGVILQIKDADGEIVAVTDDKWKCMVTHRAPIDKSCAEERNPIAGQGACGFEVTDAPANWDAIDFDASGWPSATEHSERAVRPKDGYDQISWNSSARLIWGNDLETDNTVLCRLVVKKPIAALITPPVLAHENQTNCAAVKASVSEAGFADEVTVTCSGEQALITSDTYPDHELMTGIVGTNEQLPVPANYSAPILLKPSLGTSPLTRDKALGVAVNGVPIYDYTGGGEMSEKDLYHHQTQHDTLLTQQLDVCGGHAGRGDDYHYHVKPTCMIEKMANAGDAAILGWAFDGFPIYGDNNPDGTPIAVGVLDVCNGQADDTFGYRYHTSQKAPYIVQCLMGEVEAARSLPRVAPLSPAAGGRGRKAGKPPRGGVQNLVFTQDATGTRRMDYTYQGEAYYMRYTLTSQVGCYAFETRTVTDNGAVKTGVYCR